MEKENTMTTREQLQWYLDRIADYLNPAQAETLLAMMNRLLIQVGGRVGK